MPDKLSQSLDQILSERKKNARSGRPGRAVRRPGAKATTAAPVGGVKKTLKGSKAPARGIPTGPSNGARDSKIVVSNLPLDVTEGQIKDYFTQMIGSVKKVDLSYGLGGKSKGIATVIFSKPEAAAKAAKDLDGLKVDTRPMKIEVIISAKDAPAPPAPKTLSDRITKPKNAANAKPKPATAAKTEAGGKGKGKAAGRGRNAGRPKTKSAEELDAEMQDYFEKPAGGEGDAAMSNGGAVQPSGGDAGMDDDVIA
ncbi:hypothetical protein EJ08DRAFT_636244 [Tothia fuscella]|uniref:RRM domain-containing protein n=1 Tax=Tothia fuscella TaxID=1048955 RepID=A0A9P4TW49_9PEZI|nr:hypothetical protein EJ08DRAFT_636244 [Tothia fuscella]